MNILLHACCGPCAIAPVEMLISQGHKLSLAYVNSNIAPKQEYDRRHSALAELAHSWNLELISPAYNPDSWEQQVAPFGYSGGAARCASCYRIRFDAAARIAVDHGFDALSTTLSISPYQHTEVIQTELERVARSYNLTPLFLDFRPLFQEGQKKARDLNVYRQDCCGCRFSAAQAVLERAQHKRKRKAEKQAQRSVKRALAELTHED